MNLMSILLLAAIIIVPLGIIFLIVKYFNNNLMKQYGIFAIKYGTIVEARKFLGLYRHPFIKTEYNSRDLHIGSYGRGYGEHRTTTSFVNMSVRPTKGKIFDIYIESFHSELEKDLEDHDIQINDPEFDKNFSIRCNDEDFIKKILTDKVKQKFYEVLAKEHFASVQLKDDQLQFAQAGLISDEDKRELFETMVDLLYCVGDQIEEVSKF